MVFLSEIHCLLRPGTGCPSVPCSPYSGSLGKYGRQQEGKGEGAFYSSDLGLDPSLFLSCVTLALSLNLSDLVLSSAELSQWMVCEDYMG